MTKSILWPFSKENKLYSESLNMERIHGGITFVAFLGILFATLITSAIFIMTFKGLGYELPELIANLLQFVFFIVFVWLYAKFVEKRSFASLGFFGRRKLRDYTKGVIIGLLLLSVSFIIVASSSKANIVYSFNFNIYSVLSILSVLGFFLIQGASEEIFMRGWFMQSIAVRHWPWLGILLSTLIFTLLHAANPNLNVVAIVNLFLIGIFLAILALYDENLWGACGFHSAWNFTMNSIYGVQVSGNKLTGETLMQSNFEGNELITGSGFGLEGSLVVTTIIVIATILLILLRTKRLNYGNKN